ncbi:putative ribonuclease H-like domain-containing protein [Tanacetum coccineum]
MPLTPDLSFTSLDEFVNEPVVENCKAMSSEEEPKVVRKNDDALIIEEWVSDDEEEDVSQPKIQKKTVRPISVNTARQVNIAHSKTTVNAARPMSYLSKEAYSTVKRPIHKTTTFKNSNINQKGNPQMDLQDQGVIDSGCSRCHVTILNTIDHLGKFDGKADEGFFVGYSLNSKAFRVFNSRTRIVEENLHIRFSESTPNVVGSGPDWLFDIDALTRTMNYEPIVADPKSSHNDGSKPSSDDGKKVDEDPRKDSECNDQEKEDNVNNTNNVNVVSTNKVNVVGGKTSIELPFDPNMPALEDYSIFDFSRDDEDDGAVADMNNLDTTIQVSPILTTRIHKDHPLD